MKRLDGKYALITGGSITGRLQELERRQQR